MRGMKINISVKILFFFPHIIAYTNLDRIIQRRRWDLKPENTLKRVIFEINTLKLLKTQSPHEKRSVVICNF